MPEVDVVDDTWIGVPAHLLGCIVGDPANWHVWWPELTVVVQERRGAKGMRWQVPSGRDGAVTGSMEIWLEPADDGTVVHYFARFSGARRPLRPRERVRLQHEYRIRMKQVLFAMADRVDPGRIARLGGPPTGIP
ncbi:MAG TPA: polyketide cyclase / dehydrase and lipid transport [Jatrophihabitans sp.]